jgi:hypothetical protein
MASLNGKLFMFQLSHDPLVFDPSVSTTTYRRVSELTGYSGTVQSSNVAISAYGRLWTANTATDKVTVQWCDIKNGAAWTSGTSGTLDVTTVWPQGGDNIVALGAHNGFLYIFGSNSILIYSGATSPSTMTLYDTVVGIGCIARDSVCSTGTDIIFLSSTGVRSLQRTIQEKSAPLRDVSKNVRNDLMQEVSGELTSGIKAVFSPREAFYVLALPVAKVAYCFDTKTALQDGAARVTKWTTTSFFTSFLYRQDGSLLIGKTSYVGLYTGYQDNGSSYRFQYYTNNTDLGTPSVTSILKRLAVVVIGGSNQILTMKWGYDFSTNYYSENVNIPSQGVAYYGVAEYNSTAEYSSGISLQTLRSYPTGSGKIVQVGFEADINGSALSIQKIEIHAKEGKIA